MSGERILVVDDSKENRDFIIDYRPDAGIRISPHFYSTDDECDAIVAEIAALASGRPGLRTTRAR